MIGKVFATRLSRVFLSTFSVALLLGPTAIAQDKSPSAAAVAVNTPAITVALNSFDKLVPDLLYLMRASGLQRESGMVTLFANQYTQGLDRTRAIGFTATVPADGDLPKMFLMLPIKDLDTFFASNANFIAQDKIGDNKYSLTVAGSSSFHALYDQQWLYVTQFEDDLLNHPKDPTTLTKPLIERYDLGVNVNLAAVPPEVKEQLISNLEQGFNSGIQSQQSGKSAEEMEAARKQGEAAVKELKELIQDTDQLLVGLSIDQGAKLVQLDFGSKFVPDSKTAKQTAAQAGLQSNLGAIAQSSDPIQMTFRSKLTAEEIEQVKGNLDMYTQQLDDNLKATVDDPKAREVAKKIAVILLDSLKATVSQGDIDGAYVINFTNGINFLTMSRMGAPDQLESKLIGLIQEYKSDPRAPKLTSGQAQNYNGSKLYTGTWKLPEEDGVEDLRKIVGETIPFTLAFSKQTVGFAFGLNAESNLKAALDRVQKSQPTATNPFNLTAELVPILEYVSTVVEDPKANSIIQAAITKASEFSGNDMLKVESKTVKDGVIVRLVLEEGILQAIGAASMAQGAPAPQPRRK